MIEVQCKNCGCKFRVPQTCADKKSECPQCKCTILVPSADGAESSVGSDISQSDSIDSVLDTGLFDIGGQSKVEDSQVVNDSTRDAMIDPNVFDIEKDGTVADSPIVQQHTEGLILDPKLFDVSRKDGPEDSSAARQAMAEKVKDDLLQVRAGRMETEPLPVRTLPWLIDIFLYPANKPGLTMIGILIGVPFLADVITRTLGWSTRIYPPVFLFYLIALFVNVYVVNTAIIFYRYWFIGECVRDSASGQIRAPETITITPCFEMFFSFLNIFVCICIFSVPIFYYLAEQKDVEKNFWSLLWFMLLFSRIVVSEIGKSGMTFHLLLLFAVAFFPMTVLSVIMFDSLHGLNPVLILRSIFRTFFPYCGLILLLCILAVPVVLLRKFYVDIVITRTFGFSLYSIAIVRVYLVLVASHLLGRFYWKYEEKLNWEV